MKLVSPLKLRNISPKLCLGTLGTACTGSHLAFANLSTALIQHKASHTLGKISQHHRVKPSTLPKFNKKP